MVVVVLRNTHPVVVTESDWYDDTPRAPRLRIEQHSSVLSSQCSVVRPYQLYLHDTTSFGAILKISGCNNKYHIAIIQLHVTNPNKLHPTYFPHETAKYKNVQQGKLYGVIILSCRD